MPKCPACEDGYREIVEDGRTIREACYKCGTTGAISDEQMLEIMREGLASSIAYNRVMKMKKSVNEAAKNGDGEDWGFLAAENQLTPAQYTDIRCAEETERIEVALGKLEPELVTDLLELMNAIRLKDKP